MVLRGGAWPRSRGGEQRSANQGDTSPFHKNNLVVTEQLVRRHERIGNAGERLVVLAHEFETLASIDDVRVLELGLVRVQRENERQGRVLTVLIALVRFEVRKP